MTRCTPSSRPAVHSCSGSACSPAPLDGGPGAGALCVWLFARIARAAEPEAGDGWVVGATLLFAATPFAVFMFGSYTNHVTALLWIMVAVVSLIKLIQWMVLLPFRA